MSDDEKSGAEMALKNALWNVQQGHSLAAQSWAESAAEMIAEANYGEDQQRRLVAPSEGATAGDKAAITLSAFVLMWMVADMIWGML
jgi:hypothetical protein